MKIVNHNGNPFYVAHMQGDSIHGYYSFVKEFMDLKISLPLGLEIITSFNLRERAILANQLEKNGVPYINKVKPGCQWNNTMKIKAILEALDEVKSDYVLIMDANDVLISGSLKSLLTKFKTYNRKMIFNATKNNYPNTIVDIVPDRDSRKEFKYLNAGVCISETKFARTFYKEAYDLHRSGEIYNPVDSEQLIIRNVFKNDLTDVDFDFECNLFQTFGNTRTKKLGENIYGIF